MTSATALASAAPQTLNFSCSWSEGYLVAGQPNAGELELTATSTEQPLPITQGQQLVFLDLPANWAIKPRTSDWVPSTLVYRGTTLPALTYVGERMRLASYVHVFAREPAVEAEMRDIESPETISVIIDVPEEVANLVRVHLQLFDEGEAISSQSSVLFSSVEPDAPYVAFAGAPGVVLITDPSAIAFPNALDVTLLNLRDTAGTDIPATLTLQAFDANQNPVPITSSLGTVEVSGGGAAWTYAEANNNWTTTIPGIDAQGLVGIAIDRLELDLAAIELLAVTLTLDTPQTTYQTIAWFDAYGPFTMAVSLSAAVDDSKFYRLTETSGSTYAVNTLNKNMDTPPLQPDLTDSSDSVVYPPVPGWYSWSPNSHIFPSDYQLGTGANTLYYLVNAGGTLMPLTTATVDYNFSPNEIYASGYQQGYGDTSNPQFGPIMPAGAIILWSGLVGQIPAGWALCDGNNNTPNLQSSFVVGAGNTEQPNTSGPATSHNHNFNFSGGYTTDNGGTHSHALPSTWYSRGLSCGAHPGIDTNWTTVQNTRIPDDGLHNHTLTIAINQNTADVVAPRPAWYALCYIMKL